MVILLFLKAKIRHYRYNDKGKLDGFNSDIVTFFYHYRVIQYICSCMLTDYINAAMRHAHYEFLKGDKLFYGEIPTLHGVMATGETLEVCRDELKSVLEGWIIVSLQFNDPIPEIDGITFKPKQLIHA
jgi:predicted RNase H-like HicB family nuclease